MDLLDNCFSLQYPGWGMNGAELHHPETGVPPDRWCISRGDVRFLRRQISDKIASGAIKPTVRDPFDIEDRVCGPNMYTVVEAWLKPLTRGAGKMSWALLRRPKGMECGMFITHGWAEGVFEFIDKLLCSWPRFTFGAWCCIFANPQNLNIGAMISDPLSSSFAVALRSCSQVMVVPNQQVSIYSRIWCVYEAYLAVEQDIVVFTATPSLYFLLSRRVFVGVGVAALGWLAGAGAAPYLLGPQLDDLIVPSFSIAVGLAVIPQVCAWPRVNLAVDVLGVLISCAAVGIVFTPHVRRDGVALNVVTVYGGYLLAYFVANEYDRVLLVRDRADAERLHCGYAGAVEAQASVQEDKDRIMGQIGEQLARVDDSIKVLISAGRSTPRLRALASKGYFFERSRDFRFTLAVTALRVWVEAGNRLHASGSDAERVLLAAVVLASCLLVALILRGDMDEKAFVMAAIGMVQCLDFVWLFCLAIVSRGGCLERASLWLWNGVVLCGLTCLATLLAVVGRRRLTEIPYVERILARLRA